jgi:putative oxidoreductase
MRELFQTDNSWTGLILRVTLGAVMFPHGAQKLLGWFGGPGYSQAMALFTTQMHIPATLAVLVIVGESIGAVGLILGFFSRVAAFGILCDMTGAIAMVHWNNGFFMNWSGKQGGEGFEYHLLAIAISLAVLFKGGGRGSVDRALAKRLA